MLDSRLVVSLRNFFQTLDKAGATVRIVEDEHDAALDSLAIHRGRERMEATQTEDTESEQIQGELLGHLAPCPCPLLAAESGRLVVIAHVPAPKLQEHPVALLRNCPDPRRTTFSGTLVRVSSSHNRLTISDQFGIFWISSSTSTAPRLPASPLSNRAAAYLVGYDYPANSLPRSRSTTVSCRARGGCAISDRSDRPDDVPPPALA